MESDGSPFQERPGEGLAEALLLLQSIHRSTRSKTRPKDAPAEPEPPITGLQ
jgi:hypothetical protein